MKMIYLNFHLNLPVTNELTAPNLNLKYFCSPVCKAENAPLNYAGRAGNSDVWLNVVKFSTTENIAPVNYTKYLLEVATVYSSQ